MSDWREMTEPPTPDEDPRAFSRTITNGEDEIDIAGATEAQFQRIIESLAPSTGETPA